MSEAETSPTIMNVEEVAHYLRVASATVYRLAQRGEIPAAKVGRVWRFQRTAIDRWLEEQGSITLLGSEGNRPSNTATDKS